MLEPMLAAFAAAKARYPDRVLINCVIGDEALLRRYEAAGCLVFEDPTRAVRAVAALARFGEVFAHAETGEPDAGPGSCPPLPDGPISELAAKRILAEAGIPAVEERLASSADEAVAAAEALGWPVVLKIASPDIPHKTEVGAVHLGLTCEADLRGAYDSILASCRGRCPEARLEGVLVARQAPPGVETILGVQRDPVFGPVVMVGLGGVLVEALGDVAFRVPPFDAAEARAMIEELRGAVLLNAFRGRGAVDKAALVDALVALSRFAAAQRDSIEAIDVNPFLVLPRGRGALALDALISRRVPPDRG
jgi:acyl-CoA synthetase (NDP forming)